MKTHSIVYPDAFQTADHLLIAFIEDALDKFGFEFSSEWRILRDGNNIQLTNPDGYRYLLKVIEIVRKDQTVTLDYTLQVEIVDELIELLPIY